MTRHTLIAAVLVLATASSLLAAQPGERAKGAEFKADGFTLVWGKMKTTGDVDLGDPAKSRFSLQLDGSLDVPTNVDVVAVLRRFRIVSMTDEKGAQLVAKPPPPPSTYSHDAYNAIHGQVGQVEMPRTDLLRDASRISTMTLETDVVIARKRVEVKLPAVVMEDFKDVGEGVSIRITSLQMSTGRELSVTLSFKRSGTGSSGTVIEAVYAVDPAGKDIGGGRWTFGNPFGPTGTWTGKFKVDATQLHQSFRITLLTENEVRKVSFPMKMAGLEMLPGGAGGTVASASPPVGPPEFDAPPPVAPIPSPSDTPAPLGPIEPPPVEPEPEDPTAARAADARKRTVLALRTADYSEIEGLTDLWLAPLEQTGGGGGKARNVTATGRLRYIGDEDLSEYDLKLQIVYRDRTGRTIGMSTVDVPGRALKADKDHIFRMITPLSEEYSVLQSAKVVYVSKVKSPPPKPR